MKLIQHPHVVELYEVLQDNKNVYLIMEYVDGGELFDFIVQRGEISILEAWKLFSQIVEGLEYCHTLLICHRDLKPENLLLDSSKQIKIADFGMASIISEGELQQTSCGSPHYASPEVVKGERYNGMEADIWSLGVILFALVSGRLPFDDKSKNLGALLNKVKSGKFEMPENLSEDLQDLISKMLQVDPSKRLCIKEIKKHEWFKKMKKEMNENKEEHKEEEEEEEEQEKFVVEKDNVDEDILKSMLSMGFKDSNEVVTQLVKEEKNIETVLYLLLLDRKKERNKNNRKYRN